MTKRLPRRRVNVSALRAECAELRYTSVFVQLSQLSDAELNDLLHRARAALDDLELVIFAHDDSPIRIALAGVGGVGAVYSIITMSGALGVAVALLGAGIAIREGVKLGETLVRLRLDEVLFDTLADFLDQLRAEYRRRKKIP